MMMLLIHFTSRRIYIITVIRERERERRWKGAIAQFGGGSERGSGHNMGYWVG
jgi:hypothetical protein